MKESPNILSDKQNKAFRALSAGYGPTMQMDARGKVYAKLDAEELKNIAKAVIDELRKNASEFHPATLSL